MISDKNVLSFTNQDYLSILDEIMEKKHELMPEYTDDTDTDFGNLILTYCAMLFDILSNKLDYSVNEAIPMLSETIKSMYVHCKWIGYKPKSNLSATTKFEFTIVNDGNTQTINKGSKITMPYMVDGSYVLYEITDNIVCVAPHGVNIGEQYKVVCDGTQGESITETIGISDGTSDQSFIISNFPYIENSMEIEVKDINNYSEFYRMNENNSFIGSKKTDKIFVIEQLDYKTVAINFGDGINGNIPDNGSSIIAHYRIGGGAIGNRPIGVINVPMFDMPQNFISVKNITEASGGVNAENVDDIKQIVKKGRHKIIYSLMREQDFINFLSKPQRNWIEKFKVMKDTINPQMYFRPIAFYIKPKDSYTISPEQKTKLLNEMNMYKLVDDSYNIYDIQRVNLLVTVNVMSDGLTILDQLKNAIIYKIYDYIKSMDISGDGDVGIYTDDIRNIVRQVEGVKRFISIDKLNLKDSSIQVTTKTQINSDTFDIVLKRGQMFDIDNIETDIKVTLV